MKKLILSFALNLLSIGCFSQGQNYAMQFDGVDDEIDIFMDVIQHWTVEAWVKGNDSNWEVDEVIVGSGWVPPAGGIWEDYPITLINGVPTVYRTGVEASAALDDQWHHIASTCDGNSTKLYVDGVLVDSRNSAKPMAPNFIGSDDGSELFKGMIDEVRIWNKALTETEINDWKNKSIEPSHPSYNNMVAYYTFDDQAPDANDFIGNNTGDIKNDDYYEKSTGDPIYVLANNNNFTTVNKDMELLSSEVIQNIWPVKDNANEIQVLKLKLSLQGSNTPLKLNKLNLDFSNSSSLNGIESVKIYSIDNTPDNSNRTEIFIGGASISNNVLFSESIGNAFSLKPGLNYFEIIVETNSNLTKGEYIEATVDSYELNENTFSPTTYSPKGRRDIISSEQNPDIVKTLAFNIWHGGRESGYDLGVERTIDIIRESGAEIVFMVESYGAQAQIANTLGYYMHTPGSSSNLSILSKFPIVKVFDSNFSDFQSIGVKVRLNNGREVNVHNVWLRYSTPDYSSDYRRADPTPNIWINGDASVTVPDLKSVFSQDVKPNHDDPNTPVLIGGDFNSASHLDWTEATKSLHEGAGAVDWPTHKVIIDEEGYTDSYRAVHPDPLTHQGSTWAAIYKWSNNLRIDYIYHKGPYVETLDSRVIETHPDAGVMWPGDHGAVLTTYDFSTQSAPIANFSANNYVYKGQKVSFIDESANSPKNWEWTFNGGSLNSSSDKNPTISYNLAGTYDVSLKASNQYGNDTETKNDYIIVVEDDVNNCLEFDGNNDYVSLGEANDFIFGSATNFSVELWINPENQGGDPAIIGNKDWSNGNNLGWVLFQEDSKFKLNLMDGTTRINGYDDIEIGGINAGQWSHVAFTIDRTGTMKGYLNGVNTVTEDLSNMTGELSSSLGMVIGADSDDDYFWEGKIDELRIWSDIRTAAEIQETYECELDPENDGDNLISYYKFNQENSEILIDRMGKANGVLSNMDQNSDWITADAVSCRIITSSKKELLEKGILEIFPNPNQGSFTIKSTEEYKNGTLEIFNMEGKLVYSIDLSKKDNQPLIVNAQKLKSGAYTVRLSDSLKVDTSLLIIESK